MSDLRKRNKEIEKVWKLTEKGIMDYNGKVGSLEEVVQVLNNYHFKQNQDLKNRNNLQSEIQNLKKENVELKQENEQLKENCRNYEQGSEHYIDELKREHYDELMEEGVKIERLRAELKQLKQENDELQQKIQGYKDDRLRFEEESRIEAIDNVIDEENEKLKKENAVLRTRIAVKEAYIAGMEHKGR